MQKELIKFIVENNLGCFKETQEGIRLSGDIFKTRDAKAIHNKVISKIADNFIFSDTKSLLGFFEFTNNAEEIRKRQDFFKSLGELFNGKPSETEILKNLRFPKQIWKPKYDITVATSNEKTFIELKKLGCPVKYITSSEDVLNLESCDVIQVVDCEEFEQYLEQLNQSIFINDIEEAYLERYLELLSGWKTNLEIIEKMENPEIKNLVLELRPILGLISEKQADKLSLEQINEKLENANDNLSEKIKNISVSGLELFEMLSKNSLSKELLKIIEEEVEKTQLPEEIFNKTIPLSLDEKELKRILREQDSNEFVNSSSKIKKYSEQIKTIPEKLARLENLLLLADFNNGISNFILSLRESFFPSFEEKLEIIDSSNLFLDNPQSISFLLDENSRCSILTGANSGGKTTLLEHIIQVIVLFQLGLPLSGKVKIPLFTEVYYFAKNKGSISKGAFETLLTQMSKINPGKQTLILADEIESVTEPGVAGKILCATSDYFIKKNCFLVIATHLGLEVKESLPERARIDGIEAQGLDENNELIVNHNPILGRLAHSTPELIIEKMARSSERNAYIEHVFNWVKNQT